MNALLPYLKQIADALMSRNKEGDKKGNEALSSIEKTISVSTAKQTSTAAEGNANTSAIGATLEKGLLLTVEEEQGGETVQVVKSVFQVIMDSILAKMEDALFVTVTENNQQVRKSLAQLMHDISTALGTTNTTLASINTNTSRTASRLSTVNENLGTTNNLLGDIESNTDNIHVTAELDDSGIIDALKGNNQRSVVDAIIYADNYSVLSDIKDNTDSIENHVASIDSKTPNPNS